MQTMDTQVTTLQGMATNVFDILHLHGMYGNITGKRKAAEKQLFVEAVTAQALGEWEQDALIIRYPSRICISIRTHVLGGVAALTSVRIEGRSAPAFGIDSNVLAADLMRTLKAT